MTRGLALVALVACLSGCFGYNKSAKRWAYAGNTVLMLGGGGVIAADILTKDSSAPVMPANSTDPQQDKYKQPLSGGIVVGAVLVAAGLFGIIFNATRPNVKTSR